MAPSRGQTHESGCFFGKALNKRRLNRVVVIQHLLPLNPPFKTAVIRDVMQKAQRKLHRLTERPKRSRSLSLPPQVSKAAGVSSPLL